MNQFRFSIKFMLRTFAICAILFTSTGVLAQVNLGDKIKTAEDKMKNAVSQLSSDLQRISEGRATLALLEGITVEYYGSEMPLGYVARRSTIDATRISVKPMDNSLTDKIKQALNSISGTSVQQSGNDFTLHVNPLNDSQRNDAKTAAQNKGTEAQNKVDDARRTLIDEIKAAETEGVDGTQAYAIAQQLSDRYTGEINEKVNQKKQALSLN